MARSKITGRYQVQIEHKGRKLVCDHTNHNRAAIYKAELVGGIAHDTQTGEVWSHKAQTWLSPVTHSVISGNFQQIEQDIDWAPIANAIVSAMNEVTA